MNLNIKSVFFMSQAAAKHFIARGNGGKIINIASMLSFEGRHSRSVLYRVEKRRNGNNTSDGERVGETQYQCERHRTGLYVHE